MTSNKHKLSVHTHSTVCVCGHGGFEGICKQLNSLLFTEETTCCDFQVTGRNVTSSNNKHELTVICGYTRWQQHNAFILGYYNVSNGVMNCEDITLHKI